DRKPTRSMGSSRTYGPVAGSMKSTSSSIGGRLIVIDVKAGVNPTPRDARHLAWLRDRFGDRLDASLVMHRGEATFQLVDGVWAVPISSLWSS
ncbi:MAG: hypothetical protein WKF60_08275, partial [Ilumatobacter sp.]